MAMPKAVSTGRTHYVTNATLLPAVIAAKEQGKVTNELAKMFLLIAERYSRKSWFAGYSFREDMVAAAAMNLCANGLKFDAEKYKNPFAYYTQCCHNSFFQYMYDENKHRNIRDTLLLDAGSAPSNNFSSDNHDDYVRAHDSSSISDDRAKELVASYKHNVVKALAVCPMDEMVEGQEIEILDEILDVDDIIEF